MLLSELVKRINTRLDGENLRYEDMLEHLDAVIDNINETLNTVYPVFSDLPAGTLEYAYFPDRYIRSVVVVGAAMRFYITDEEGGNPPPGYTAEYQGALFRMLRDYLHLVPEEWKAVDTAGTVQFNLTGAESEDDVDPRVFRF